MSEFNQDGVKQEAQLELGTPDSVYSPEVLAMRDRCRNGNNKLWAAWCSIRAVKDKEQQNALFEQWDTANQRLRNLCRQLKDLGFEDCLYLNAKGEKLIRCLYNLDSPLWFCQVCPAPTEKYAEPELMSLNPPQAPRAVKEMMEAEKTNHDPR